MKKIKISSFEEFNKAITNFDNVELADAILESITKGLKNDSKKIKVCEIEIEEEEELLRLYSERKEWPLALDNCMKVFIKTEEYEKCIIIQNLKKEYESKINVSNQTTQPKRARKSSKSSNSSN
jgi:RNase adaptor protein for sRNA GlmZ degradation